MSETTEPPGSDGLFNQRQRAARLQRIARTIRSDRTLHDDDARERRMWEVNRVLECDRHLELVEDMSRNPSVARGRIRTINKLISSNAHVDFLTCHPSVLGGAMQKCYKPHQGYQGTYPYTPTRGLTRLSTADLYKEEKRVWRSTHGDPMPMSFQARAKKEFDVFICYLFYYCWCGGIVYGIFRAFRLASFTSIPIPQLNWTSPSGVPTSIPTSILLNGTGDGSSGRTSMAGTATATATTFFPSTLVTVTTSPTGFFLDTTAVETLDRVIQTLK